MSATRDLTKNNGSVDTTNDSVVIVNHVQGLPGGATLDVTGFADDEISAGHVIIKDDAVGGDYKPLPVSGTLPGAHSYAGILRASILTAQASAAIMHAGTVNEAYCKYPIAAAVKTALNRITFINQ